MVLDNLFKRKFFNTSQQRQLGILLKVNAFRAKNVFQADRGGILRTGYSILQILIIVVREFCMSLHGTGSSLSFLY